ncbi:hypothetical protein [Roseomonas xinghualingensis]|uniref:hypothetical protein n=1 Tax=Roseomonas xinghualingensis TaxID=2986475 RepID=UPI0021F0BF75|nr:hypothetical protein [Roseomonas sp. SXEYE001]MCV4208629.1 hypothetical protein [Roseomonas sp. SXEYE001]
MKTRLATLAAASLALGGCYGPYGEPDVAGSALLGAGIGAAAGAAIASGPTYYAPPPVYYAPPPRYYGYGYHYRPYGYYRRW